MNRYTVAIFCFCVLLSTPCEAVRIYRFVNYPLIQNGHTLDGTITVTDDAPLDSFLETDEILDWEWTIARADGTYVASASMATGGDYESTVSESIVVSAGAIELPLSSSASLRLYNMWPSGRGFAAAGCFWNTTYDPVDDIYSSRASAAYKGDDYSPPPYWAVTLSEGSSINWFVAEAIPEPSSALLAVFWLAAVVGLRRSRLCPASRQKP